MVKYVKRASLLFIFLALLIANNSGTIVNLIVFS